MKIALLTSGGKDSILALHRVAKLGEITLVTAIPERADSFMFHTVNLHMVDAIASCLELPLHKIAVSGVEEKEVKELEKGISSLEVDAICCGAIASSYQLKRVEKICKNLGLEFLAPLWGEDQEKILKEVAKNFDAIIVSVSAMGLDETFLGKRIDEKCVEDLKKVAKRTGINLAGEGGEYETLVLDAPLYRRRIVVKEVEKRWEKVRGVALVKKFEKIEKL
ncbi:MAG: TIGR00289 family protein [Archaeoglobaceae archaeon]